MANTIWRGKIRLGLGTRKTRDQVSIDFRLRGDASPDNFPADDITNGLVEALQPVLLTSTHIIQITYTPENPTTGAITRNRQITLRPNQVGNRAIPNGAFEAADEFIAYFSKVSLQGNPGELRLRGSLLNTDMAPNDVGEFALTNSTHSGHLQDFAIAFKQAFDTVSYELVMEAVNDDPHTTGARPVIAIAFEGIKLRQVDNKRTSIDSQRRALAIREANKINRDYLKAQKENGGPLTGAALTAFEVLVTRLVTEFGLVYLLTLPLPPAIKILIGLVGAGTAI